MSASACLGSRACGTVPVDLIVVGRVTLSITSVMHRERQLNDLIIIYMNAINEKPAGTYAVFSPTFMT